MGEVKRPHHQITMSEEEDNLDKLIEDPPDDEGFLSDGDWKYELGGGLETPVEADRPLPGDAYRPRTVPSYNPFSQDDPIVNDKHLDRFPHHGGMSPPACVSRLPSLLHPPAYPPPAYIDPACIFPSPASIKFRLNPSLPCSNAVPSVKAFEMATIETFVDTAMYQVSISWFGKPFLKVKATGGLTWDLNKARNHWRAGVSKHTGPPVG
jgi:hypothetical protein